jgi:hypothetical protein
MGRSRVAVFLAYERRTDNPIVWWVRRRVRTNQTATETPEQSGPYGAQFNSGRGRQTLLTRPYQASSRRSPSAMKIELQLAHQERNEVRAAYNRDAYANCPSSCAAP